MRSRAAAIAVLACLPLLSAETAESATRAAFARPISATIRFEPRSVPKAKALTKVVIAFDSSGESARIRAADCLCTLQISKGAPKVGAPVVRYPLHAVNHGRNELGTTLTFPSAGSYVLALTGSPKHVGAFEAFLKTFRARVSR